MVTLKKSTKKEHVSLDITKCSQPLLKTIFAPLEEFTDHVFWIRNDENSKQIYVSPSYENVWQRDAAILFDIPLLWLDYLATESKNEYMQQLQDRHMQNYLDLEKNFVWYQISQPNQENRYIKDMCFRLRSSQTNEEYLAGVSAVMTADNWHEEYKTRPKIIQAPEDKIFHAFFNILKNELDISLVIPPHHNVTSVKQYQQYFVEDLQFKLAKRELECAYYFCQGKTYKEVAKAMSISPRTVEDYLKNVMQKSGCSNKVEVVNRFARYFDNFDFGLLK